VSVQSEAAAFATTHWSIVLTAQGRSPAADEALEKLCRTYWWPLYGFVRRNGCNPEEAQDLTQVNNCVAAQNGGVGIGGSNDVLVTGCVSSINVSHGFQLGGGSTLK
jgi:hypothetical protein